MIRGIGTDLLEIERLRQMNWERLAQKILTEREQGQLPGKERRRIEFLAGRFAAKEAIAKALVMGIGQRLCWQEIEILPDELGQPQVRLADSVQSELLADAPYRIHLSISHSRQNALATAVLEMQEN